MIPDNLQDWNKGDPLRAAHWQEYVNILRKMLGLPGAGVGNAGGQGGGWKLVIETGVIVASGPNGEPDLTGAQYWVQETKIVTDSASNVNSAIEMGPIDPVEETLNGSPGNDEVEMTQTRPTTWAVTNLPELNAGSHGLVVGTDVVYFYLVDGNDVPVPHRVMTMGGAGDRSATLWLVNTAFSRGVYTVHVITSYPDIKASGTNVDELAGLSGAANALAVNWNEYLLSLAVPLDLNRPYEGRFLFTNSEGVDVYAIIGEGFGC